MLFSIAVGCFQSRRLLCLFNNFARTSITGDCCCRPCHPYVSNTLYSSSEGEPQRRSQLQYESQLLIVLALRMNQAETLTPATPPQLNDSVCLPGLERALTRSITITITRPVDWILCNLNFQLIKLIIICSLLFSLV